MLILSMLLASVAGVLGFLLYIALEPSRVLHQERISQGEDLEAGWRYSSGL